MSWRETIANSGWRDTVKDDISELESGIRGATQGASLGFADEATGALESAAGSLGLVPDKTYEQSVAESRKNYQSAEQANPMSYMGGQIAGGLASAALLPGAAPTIAGRTLQAGAMGAIAGYGSTNNREDLLKNMATGAAIGSVATPLVEGGISALGKGANYLSGKLGSAADRLAEKATGATGKQASEFKQGTGRYLLENKIVGAFDSPANVAEKAQDAMDVAGQKMADVLDSVDASGAGISVDEIVRGLEDKITTMSKDPSQAPTIRQLKQIINDIYESGESAITANQAEQIKRGFNKQAKNWMNPEVGQAGKEAYGAYKSAVEGAATGLSPEMGAQFTSAKQAYGLLSPVQEAAEKRAATLSQSPVGGLLDTTAAIAGGGGLQGVATALGRRVGANRMASTGAVTADKLSKMLQSGGLGKYSQVIQSAISRGPAAISATHFLLQQKDPEYRKLFEGQ